MPSERARGIDVSVHQGQIDWAKAKSELDFAFIKATEGVGYVDPSFVANWKGAQAAGLLVGAYHFARVSDTSSQPLLEDARAEADWFFQTLTTEGLDLDKHIVPVLDIEWDKRAMAAGITPTQTREWALEFLRQLTLSCGRRPLVYLGPTFYRTWLESAPELHQYPLWQVDIRRAAGSPKAIADWSWHFHQYSFEGTVAGIKARVDLDVFNGTKHDLQQFIAGTPATPPTQSWTPPAQLSLPKVDFNKPVAGEAVERIQALLLSQGYGPDGLIDTDTGLPDGVGGKRTRSAVHSFQAAAGLQPNGIVDEETWWALLTKGF